MQNAGIIHVVEGTLLDQSGSRLPPTLSSTEIILFRSIGPRNIDSSHHLPTCSPTGYRSPIESNSMPTSQSHSVYSKRLKLGTCRLLVLVIYLAPCDHTVSILDVKLKVGAAHLHRCEEADLAATMPKDAALPYLASCLA